MLGGEEAELAVGRVGRGGYGSYFDIGVGPFGFAGFLLCWGEILLGEDEGCYRVSLEQFRVAWFMEVGDAGWPVTWGA